MRRPKFTGYNPAYLDRRIMEREARKNRPMNRPQRGVGSVINHRIAAIILCNHAKTIEELAELVGKTKTQTHAYIQYLRSVGIAIPKRVGKAGRKTGVSSPKKAKPSLPTRPVKTKQPARPVAPKTGRLSSGVSKQYATDKNSDVVNIKKEQGKLVEVTGYPVRTWRLKKAV